jgi:type I restriction enzyme S subunit
MSTSVVLKSLILESKDGEWGKGEPFDKSVEMAVIRGTDFSAVRVGEIGGLPVRFVPEHIAVRKTLRPLDILIETAGGSKDRPTGRTVLIKESLIAKSELPLTCASFARFIRVDANKVYAPFLFWLLQTLYNQDFIRQYHTQHTGVARFQFTTFAEREPLPLPVMAVQRRVANVLSAYDDLIENNVRRIKILEQMAQMLYREWFVNFRFPGHETVKMVVSETGSIPEGWESISVGELLKFHIGGGWGEGTQNEESSCGAHVIRGTDIPQARVGTIDGCPLRYHKKSNLVSRKLRQWDVVFEVSGGSKGQPVGRALLVHPSVLSAFGGDVICASFCKLLRPDPSKIGVMHFYQYLLDAYSNGVIEKYQVQSTGITNFKTAVFLEDAKVVVPPAHIQDGYERLCKPLIDGVFVLGRKNDNLRTTRDLLLPKLVSGDVSVEQIEKEAVAKMV